jgi:hypothetical protein
MKQQAYIVCAIDGSEIARFSDEAAAEIFALANSGATVELADGKFQFGDHAEYEGYTIKRDDIWAAGWSKHPPMGSISISAIGDTRADAIANFLANFEHAREFFSHQPAPAEVAQNFVETVPAESPLAGTREAGQAPQAVSPPDAPASSPTILAEQSVPVEAD